ncbi:MAG: M48 family metallopeptidase [Pelagibacterales bacterium]|nr:M48 family metallopeptidase [Pelagibacterales bacterium]
MQIIYCNFHDGLSSESHKVTVKICDNQIIISDQIKWKFSDIIILEKPIADRPAIISNKNNADARLYIADIQFFKEVNKNVPKFKISKKELVTFLQETSVVIITLISLAIVFPIIFNFLSSKISDQKLKKLGATLTRNITKDGKNICKNLQGNFELQKLANRISLESNQKVYVVNEKTTNAIALPDGTIIIFSQLLEKLQSPNELIFVLAHEIGHLKKQHHKNLFAINSIASNMIGDYSKAITYFLTLRYSLSDEKDADNFAYDFAIKNNIDPRSFIAVLEEFKKEELINAKIFKYVSTHPALDDRISLIKDKMTKNDFNSKEFITKNSWQKIKTICQN